MIANKSEYVTGSEIKLELMIKSKNYKYNAIILPINAYDKYKRRLIASSTTTTDKSIWISMVGFKTTSRNNFFKFQLKEFFLVQQNLI